MRYDFFDFLENIPFAGPPFRRARFFGSGEIRLAILSLLSEGPKHGYQLMKEISERSGGVYRASADFAFHPAPAPLFSRATILRTNPQRFGGNCLKHLKFAPTFFAEVFVRRHEQLTVRPRNITAKIQHSLPARWSPPERPAPNHPN